METDARGALLDVVKGGAATVGIFALYAGVPVLGLLPGMFAPFPALYYHFKRGRGVGAAIVALAAAALVILMGPAASLLYLLQYSVVSLALPLFLSRGSGASRSLAYTVLVTVGLGAAVALAYGVANGVNIHWEIVKGIRGSVAQTVALYEKKGVKGDELKLLRDAMEQAAQLLGTIYPALFVVGTAMVSGLNLLLLRRASVRLPAFPRIAPFSRFRNPDQLVWVLIAAGFALLLDNAVITAVALNALIVTASLYFVQGMAVIMHLFEAYRIPAFLRVMLYIILAVQPYLAVAVAVLGLFDLWANFRTPKHKNL